MTHTQDTNTFARLDDNKDDDETTTEMQTTTTDDGNDERPQKTTTPDDGNDDLVLAHSLFIQMLRGSKCRSGLLFK